MIDLEKYGFTIISQTQNSVSYEGHGFVVHVYNYPFITPEKKEIARSGFVVDNKQNKTSSMWMNISQLEKWIIDNEINKP